VGYVENIDTGSGLAWEILHGGSWSWQIGETAGELYLHVAGPTEAQSRWWRTLSPDQSFEAVPVVVAPAASFESAVATLVRHRRRTRLTPAQPAPVVFNDYMNCLKGDPSEAAVLPLVKRAAELGAEVYCVDAGWYGPPGQRWSYLLGSWEPDKQRFPRGLAPVMDAIRSAGMTAGLWFEIEAMTDTHPGFDQFPDDWFFMRHGRRVRSHRRYQLDFRNEEVRRFADAAIEMAAGELGCGYLKMDYNFDSGPGSELGADNLGQSLLDYEKAFLGWLDGIRSRYPALMIEHCASGGMRLGRPYLDRCNVASNSDEGDPLQIARIAVAGMTQILPEQNGTWAVPQPSDTLEGTAFAMLCALPYRMFIAGGAAEAEGEQRALIEEAIALHKQVRDEIAQSVPTWPLGLPGYHDSWICSGLRASTRYFLALWRRDGGPEEISVPLPHGASGGELLYPASLPASWRVADGALTVKLEERTGRFFSFRLPNMGEPETSA
jgi:alpha-galactosidase